MFFLTMVAPASSVVCDAGYGLKMYLLTELIQILGKVFFQYVNPNPELQLGIIIRKKMVGILHDYSNMFELESI